MDTKQSSINGVSGAITICNSTNGVQITEKNIIQGHEELNKGKENPCNLIIPIYKNYKLRICKPLIWLKLALFVWNGGRGSGGAILGSIMSKYGGRVAYRVMAISCLITAILYAFYLFIRKKYFSTTALVAVTNDVASIDKEMEKN